MNTTNQDVFNAFHSHPLTKYALPDGLEEQWLVKAIADFSLEISPLNYNVVTHEFDRNLDTAVVFTLGQHMYCSYLTRDLDRLRQLNGFRTSDMQMTGSDESKRTTYNDLQTQREILREWYHKQKNVGYD